MIAYETKALAAEAKAETKAFSVETEAKTKTFSLEAEARPRRLKFQSRRDTTAPRDGLETVKTEATSLPVWLGLRRGAFTCVGWQVTLCDPIWQVTPVALRWVSHEALYTALTF